MKRRRMFISEFESSSDFFPLEFYLQIEWSSLNLFGSSSVVVIILVSFSERFDPRKGKQTKLLLLKSRLIDA